MARPRAIGAYIFAGGFSVGAQDYFDVACHLEESNYGVATARHNFPDLPVHVGIDHWPIDELKQHEWDWIYANPPCAAWSQAGAATKKGRTYDSSPLLACATRSFNLMKQLQPKVYAWESVQRAWTLGESFIRNQANEAAELGYSTTIFMHDAQYLGVPQRRQRVFFIFHRVQIEMEIPAFDPPQTIDDALSRINEPGPPLANISGKLRHLIPHSREGEELRGTFMRVTPPDQIKYNERGQVVGRPPFTVRRARAGLPAPTVMHEIIHYSEPRGLSIKELAALCGFPPMFEFIGAKDAGQVGRGVTPPVARHLARSVARAVKANVTVTEPVFTLVDYTTPPGRIEQLQYAPAEGACLLSSGQPDADHVIPDKEPKMPEVPTSRADFAPRRARTPKVASPRVTQASPQPQSPVLPPASTRPLDGEKSGRFIRRLLRVGMVGADILPLVHAHYHGSKTTMGDIAWNRGRIRKEDANGGAPLSLVVAQPEAAQPVEQLESSPQLDLVDWIDRQAPRPEPEEHVPQPQARRQGVDPNREFDKSSLRANSHGQWQSRDYAAHFFRWSWAARFVNNSVEILDVGCGPDIPMIKTLTMPRSSVPKRYVGVDLNKQPHVVPSRQWATIHWEFNVIERGHELGQFDLVTCFEAIEHMRKADGLRLLKVLRDRLRPDGQLLLSTPVFNGKAAASHVHEWGIDELREAIEASGLRIEARYGTFASANVINKVMTPEERELVRRLSEFHSGETMACFLAPIYPDASRNNVWKVKRT